MTRLIADWRVDEIEVVQEQRVGASDEIQSPATDIGGVGVGATLTNPDENPMTPLQEIA